jgi:5-carboxyvanillate decarboxylase
MQSNSSSGSPVVPMNVGYQRIATEEAFATVEMFNEYRKLLAAKTLDDPGFHSLWGFYLNSPSPRAKAIIERIQDLGERRIADMNATGISKQVLALTAPGVQVFDAPTGAALAISSNDQLVEAIRKYPDRYVGMAAIAPQDPAAAVKEMDRAVNTLGMNAVVVNSHTHHEYLDLPKYWDIFAAAEALNVPIYIHPTGPSKGLVQPMMERGLDGAVFGFGVEVALHLLRIIVAGVFDRFPKLRIVIGHCGEALPFWLFRLDYMHRAALASKRFDNLPQLKKDVSSYMKENVYITTSGMPWEPAIMFCRKVLGNDRVMYAMDYPYQFVAEEVLASDALPMTLDEKKQFFQTNAEHVFKIK